MNTNKIGATPEMRDTPKFGLGLAFNLPTFPHCSHQKKNLCIKTPFRPHIANKKKNSFSLILGGGGLLPAIGKFP